ncbi:MAG: hypothetical protein SFV19_12345 [Rhodospirillaceae bacterium]|nr:hypothetical protein [Rhodospirillaceae bacterium]
MTKEGALNTLKATFASAFYCFCIFWLAGLLFESVVPGHSWLMSTHLLPDLAIVKMEDRLIYTALAAGGLGAVVRFALRVNHLNPHSLKVFPGFVGFSVNMLAGSLLGVFAYFLIRSRALIKLFYAGELPNIELTVYGIGFLSALAGLLTKELVGSIASKLPNSTEESFLEKMTKHSSPPER